MKNQRQGPEGSFLIAYEPPCAALAHLQAHYKA